MDSNSSLIDFKDVWMTYDRKKDYILKDITFSIQKGENYSIIGPSGSGKSTILKLMNGTLYPFKGAVTVFGQLPDANKRKFRQKMKKIGYMPQNLGLVKNSTVLENVLLGALPRTNAWMSLLKVFKDGDIKTAQNAIKMVGLEGKENRKAYMLSGGEKRRVIIARTLTQKPDLILADEIVSELDYNTSREIMALMMDTKKKLGLTAVMIHHDIRLTLEYADKIMMMRDGQKICEYDVNETNESKLLEILKN
jgi:phosphonate transport system ATP-binding protein